VGKFNNLPENVGFLYQSNSIVPSLFMIVTSRKFSLFPPVSRVNCNLLCNELKVFRHSLIFCLGATSAMSSTYLW